MALLRRLITFMAPDSSAETIRLLRLGSLAVLGGYTVAICYRCGFFRKILPAYVSTALEQRVDAVKKVTEPIGNAVRFSMARRHLIQTYGLATSGMMMLAAGAVSFRFAQHIPVAVPVTVGLVSLLLLGLPRNLMIPAARVLCFYTSLLSAGYVAGPLCWVAQDTLLLFVLLTGCTMTGLCVPLFLTRGMVSYVVSAQCLTCALSLSLVTAPKKSPDYSPFKLLKAQPGTQLVLNGDINVLLTMQMLMSVGISALHTLPTIYHYVSFQVSERELVGNGDPLREAFCICAGANYVAYRLVKYCIHRLLQHVLAEDTSDIHRGSLGSWTILGARRGASANVSYASGLVSGLFMVLWYVGMVSLLQRGDAKTTLDRVRGICARCSPLAVILGSNSVYMSATKPC